MDGFEILAIVTGLFLGYWLVSYFLNHSVPENTKNQHQEGNSEETSKDSSSSSAKDWYQVLEVSSSATFEEVSSAYKRRMSKYHPDKVNSLGEEFKELAEQKAKEINSAYDEAKRYFGKY